ncbi:hypothetical protein EU537_06120 [Candidatus Thorarchaeota archaeon]|nr:MAG: hypothetical protein EU537_06120 [Candidatus Thorarchaeota archaeon]
MSDLTTESVVKRYLAFAVAYCATTAILLLGPVFILEDRLVALIYYQMGGYDILILYLLVLPFLTLFASNFYSFGMEFGTITENKSRVLLGIIISVVVASAEIFLAIWVNNSIQSAYWESMTYVVTGALLILTLIMAHTLVTVMAFTDTPRRTAKRIVSDPTFWFAFPIILGLLLLSLYPVFEAQTLEGLLPQPFQDDFCRSIVELFLVIPTCFLIPALPWIMQQAAAHEI